MKIHKFLFLMTLPVIFYGCGDSSSSSVSGENVNNNFTYSGQERNINYVPNKLEVDYFPKEVLKVNNSYVSFEVSEAGINNNGNLCLVIDKNEICSKNQDSSTHFYLKNGVVAGPKNKYTVVVPYETLKNKKSLVFKYSERDKGSLEEYISDRISVKNINFKNVRDVEFVNNKSEFINSKEIDSVELVLKTNNVSKYYTFDESKGYENHYLKEVSISDEIKSVKIKDSEISNNFSINPIDLSNTILKDVKVKITRNNAIKGNLELIADYNNKDNIINIKNNYNIQSVIEYIPNIHKFSEFIISKIKNLPEGSVVKCVSASEGGNCNDLSIEQYSSSNYVLIGAPNGNINKYSIQVENIDPLKNEFHIIDFSNVQTTEENSFIEISNGEIKPIKKDRIFYIGKKSQPYMFKYLKHSDFDKLLSYTYANGSFTVNEISNKKDMLLDNGFANFELEGNLNSCGVISEENNENINNNCIVSLKVKDKEQGLSDNKLIIASGNGNKEFNIKALNTFNIDKNIPLVSLSNFLVTSFSSSNKLSVTCNNTNGSSCDDLIISKSKSIDNENVIYVATNINNKDKSFNITAKTIGENSSAIETVTSDFMFNKNQIVNDHVSIKKYINEKPIDYMENTELFTNREIHLNFYISKTTYVFNPLSLTYKQVGQYYYPVYKDFELKRIETFSVVSNNVNISRTTCNDIDVLSEQGCLALLQAKDVGDIDLTIATSINNPNDVDPLTQKMAKDVVEIYKHKAIVKE